MPSILGIAGSASQTSGTVHNLVGDDIVLPAPTLSSPVLSESTLDITMRCTRVLVTSSGATQDITISGFGTPKSAAFFNSSANADGVDAATGTHTTLAVGFTDGTNERAIFFFSQDNVANGSAASAMQAQVGGMKSSGGSLEYIGFNSWITDGVRIDKSLSQNFLLTVWLMKGGDLDSACGDVAANGSVSGLSFQPDLVLALSVGSPSYPFSSGNAKNSFGVSYRNGGVGTQEMAHVATYLNGANPSSVNGQLRTDALAGQGASAWFASVSTWAADGFTFDGGVTDKVAYLAIGLNGGKAKIDTAAMPTSTGDDAVAGLGFDPKFALFLATDAAADDTAYTDGRAAGWSIGVADATAAYCTMWGAQDGQTTNNAWHGAAQKLVSSYDDSGATKLNEATMSSFDTGGYTPNYSTVDASAQRVGRLVIECNN
jgi:hypothetical protein